MQLLKFRSVLRKGYNIRGCTEAVSTAWGGRGGGGGVRSGPQKCSEAPCWWRPWNGWDLINDLAWCDNVAWVVVKALNYLVVVVGIVFSSFLTRPWNTRRDTGAQLVGTTHSVPCLLPPQVWESWVPAALRTLFISYSRFFLKLNFRWASMTEWPVLLETIFWKWQAALRWSLSASWLWMATCALEAVCCDCAALKFTSSVPWPLRL